MSVERPMLGVGGVILFAEQAGPSVVLVRRKNPPNAGAWTLPGGRTERGETLAAALAREIGEETGLAVEVGPLVEVVEIIEADRHFVVLDYLCDPRGGELVAGDDAAAVARARVGELDRYGLTEAVLRVIDKALRL